MNGEKQLTDPDDEPRWASDVAARATGDWMLDTLLSMVENTDDGSSIGITVSVPGGVISGDLVSRSTWLDALGEHDAAAAFAQGMKQGIERVLNKTKDAKEEEEDGEKEKLPFNYIHIRNARFIAPGGSPTPQNDGLHWRGRVREISGWSLGVMKADSI